MLPSVLRDVAALLMRHSESAGTSGPPSEQPAGQWRALVRVVLEQGRPAKKIRDWSWIAETSLGNARDAAQQSVPGLADVLESAGHAGNKAALLRALALWWQPHFGDADASTVFRGHSLEHWQDELRAIRGVSWELADRILLLVAGFAVYPLDRGSMRIACRHGWMDAGSEYDDWQAFFVSPARDSGVDLKELSRMIVQVGRVFCGRIPDCESCPLKSLLPTAGPVTLDGEE